MFRNITLSPRLCTRSYLLLLCSCFFLWPVSLGISDFALRLLWIGCAALLTITSVRTFATTIEATVPVASSKTPWLALIFSSIAMLMWNMNMPPVAFGDELTILLPALAVASALARALSWPGLLLLAVLCLLFFVGAIQHKRFWPTAMLGGVLLLIGILCAFFGAQSGLALRYPPLLHLLQTATTILTFGSPQLFRSPNAVWTIGFGWLLWKLLPQWPSSARWAAFIAIFLGPLGWTYRTVLYQACGELTLGLAASLLLGKILLHPAHTKSETGFLGALFALWMLYRPTSLAATVCSIFLLWIKGDRGDAKTIAKISLPISLAWLLLAPLYTVQYGFGSAHRPLLESIEQIFRGLGIALFALPLNFHPIGLTILILGSLLAWKKVGAENHMYLFASWVIALSTALPQQVLAGDVFFGVARYNILLLLPLALSIGMLMAEKGWIRSTGASALFILTCITPFWFTTYAQQLRHSADRIYYKPTEGYLPLPTLEALQILVAKQKDFAFIGPQRGLLDLFMAQSKLTKEEREKIVARSNAWHLSAPTTPVLIQAPVQTRYQPNLSADEEAMLREARTWGYGRPHSVVTLGTEETLIVWE